MPEGDAVWRTARRLHTALSGDLLLGADLRVPALATKDLVGRHTLEVVPRGKHLLHRIEGGLTLHSHLRMDGSWRVLHRTSGDSGPPQQAATRKHTVRAVLWTDSAIAVGDRLGMLDLVETTHEDRLVGHLGPDLLDRGFNRDLALSNLLRDRSRPVAEALLDQRNLAGIGTIYASEPLFEHRANPWTPVGQMDPELLGAVVDTARLWLVRSCKLSPGALRGAVGRVPADGWLPWRPRVFGREGRPCPRCGTPIRQGTIGAQPREREISYCPRCQGSPHVLES
ncbi:MAG TPA: DNA-formamidopyrimidine glycosylase family protein [Ornithinicoccus sp.]|nr:DNA-formamidopyrimidine glycosylase family protein [Ornithinicoccus sp.]